MKIGEFSRRLGVTAPTVRFYEKLGVIPRARRSSGTRLYDQEAIQSLRIVLALKRIGFTLVEIKALLAGLPAPDARALWQRFARAKLVEVEDQIAELLAARRLLKQSFDCDCEGLADRCRVVSVADEWPASRRRNPRGKRSSSIATPPRPASIRG